MNTSRGPEEKLTISEVCAELKISRSTFYDWRSKRRARVEHRTPRAQQLYRDSDREAGQ